MASLPPLSGAILVSNPRKEEPSMASTRNNPNNRRTVNLIARVAMDGKVSKAKKLEERVEHVAKKWFSERNKPSSKRTVSRTAVYGKVGTRGKKFKAKKGSPSKLRPSSAARKLQYATAKRIAAQSLARLYKMKGQKATDYVDRVLGAKGAAYLSSDKKMSKSYFGGTRKGEAVNVKGVREWNADRVARRAAGKWGHAHGRSGYRKSHPFPKKHASAVKRAKSTLAAGRFKKIKRAHAEDWTMARKSSKKKAGSTASRRRSARKGSASARKAMKLKHSLGISLKAAWKKIRGGKAAPKKRKAARKARVHAKHTMKRTMRSRRKSKGRSSSMARKVMKYKHSAGVSLKAAWAHFGGKKSKAKSSKRKSRKAAARRGTSIRRMEASRRRRAFSNPSALGDLALTNPTMVGAKQYLLAYAIPVTLAGAAAGGVHAFAASKGLPQKISEMAEKVPVVGTYLAKVPFTIQGAAVGAGLALIAPMVGGKAGESLALAGGAALIFGGGIDAFNILSAQFGGESLGDLALTNESALGDLAFGDLAFTNMGDLGFNEGSSLGDLALANSAPLGDGMAYMTAPLTADLSQVDYGQASLQDAYYSGADFSAVEGQAILNGKGDFIRKFGAPPIRMGAKAVGHSHLAGRHGHRWGWLVKMVGWKQAQRIASMSPKDRIEVLRKIRSAALAAAQQSQIMDKAQELAHQSNMEAAQDSAPISGSAASAPAGAEGAQASNGLGDLFAGEEYGATLFAQA